MNYSNALDNPHPNAHDYDQLETIYNSHRDSTSTVSAFPSGEPRSVSEERRGFGLTYRVEDYGNGFRVHTFITWAIERQHDHDH